MIAYALVAVLSLAAWLVITNVILVALWAVWSYTAHWWRTCARRRAARRERTRRARRAARLYHPMLRETARLLDDAGYTEDDAAFLLGVGSDS